MSEVTSKFSLYCKSIYDRALSFFKSCSDESFSRNCVLWPSWILGKIAADAGSPICEK